MMKQKIKKENSTSALSNDKNSSYADYTQPRNAAEQSVDGRSRFWNRMQLILLLVVFLAPIVGAYFYKPSKLMNYGDLHASQQLSEIALTRLSVEGALTENKGISNSAFLGSWVFLSTASEVCNQQCEENILHSRQLRLMQNHNMNRIRSVFIYNKLPADLATELVKKYNPVEFYQANSEQYSQWFDQLRVNDKKSIRTVPQAIQDNRFYIIDPKGRVIVSYRANSNPKFIHKDITRLLKTS